MQSNKILIKSILSNYKKLALYCDNFFNQTIKKFPKDIHCRRGCGSCCKLTSVCALEAAVLVTAIESLEKTISTIIKKQKPGTGRTCPFLVNKECMVYNARPVICRTHGLPISHDGKNGQVSVCPKNFRHTQASEIDGKYLLNAEVITLNMMRLNLAFCMEAGNSSLAQKRFLLDDIRKRKVPKQIIS